MSKLIDAYSLIEKINKIVEFDYSGLNGFELTEIVKSILDELPSCMVTDEFFEGMCEACNLRPQETD